MLEGVPPVTGLRSVEENQPPWTIASISMSITPQRHDVMSICAGKHLSWSQRSNDQQQEHSIAASQLHQTRSHIPIRSHHRNSLLGEMRRVYRSTILLPAFHHSSRLITLITDHGAARCKLARESCPPYLCCLIFAAGVRLILDLTSFSPVSSKEQRSRNSIKCHQSPIKTSIYPSPFPFCSFVSNLGHRPPFSRNCFRPIL